MIHLYVFSNNQLRGHLYERIILTKLELSTFIIKSKEKIAKCVIFNGNKKKEDFKNMATRQFSLIYTFKKNVN